MMSMFTAIISSIEDEGSTFLPSIYQDFMDDTSTGLKKKGTSISVLH